MDPTEALQFWRSLSYRCFSVLAVLLVVGSVNAPLLDDFARLVRLPELAASSPDSATHFLRVLNARDLYLPSGHHWGWDPYWYQGFVPFLLYPHLTYVLLALCSSVLPIEPARVFNFYTLAIYLALPLVGGIVFLRSRGLAAALLVAAWCATLTTVGAGLEGVFVQGLLSQQAGVLVFFALTYDLVVSGRVERAAIWLGILPLVHVHSAMAGAILWLGTLPVFVARNRAPLDFRAWVQTTAISILIASPVLVGLYHSWGEFGGATSFGSRDASILAQLAKGRLGAPWPTLLSIAIVAGSVVKNRTTDRTSSVTWMAIGAILALLSLHKWSTGIETLDRVFHSILYVRTLPFVFIVFTVLAAGGWLSVGKVTRFAAIGLAVLGAFFSWSFQNRVGEQIGSPSSKFSTSIADSASDYRQCLDWIKTNIGTDTATLAISVPNPRALPLFTAIQRTGLPMLGGHGPELASVRNGGLTGELRGMTCEDIRRQIQQYGVGYLIGSDPEVRSRLEACLEQPPATLSGPWWVFATGQRWLLSPPLALEFVRNAYWTEFAWSLKTVRQDTVVRLPIANSAPWTAEVDGRRVAIESTSDRMMKLSLPRGGSSLYYGMKAFLENGQP